MSNYELLTEIISEFPNGDAQDIFLMERFELLKGGKLSDVEFEQYKARWIAQQNEPAW